MKKMLVVLFFALFIVSGCENNETDVSDKTLTQETSQKKVKTDLEQLGLTYGQSVKFDDFCKSVSDNITLLQSFNSKVLDEYESLDELSTADILIECNKIESSYLDNGGTEQEDMVHFLQESTFGFFNIGENMYRHHRGYTETEAYGNLQSLTSFVEEIGSNYGLQKKEVNELQKYFLENITTKGNFMSASKELLSLY